MAILLSKIYHGYRMTLPLKMQNPNQTQTFDRDFAGILKFEKQLARVVEHTNNKKPDHIDLACVGKQICNFFYL